MRPTFAPEGFAKTKPSEYLLRFAFGGLVTVCTGLVAREWGPSVGGLFLAFPAILPASLTLVRRHDGREQAVDDARGAVLGSIGMAAFAFVIWCTAERWSPVVVLPLATLAWIAASTTAWALCYGGHRTHGAARAGRRPWAARSET